MRLLMTRPEPDASRSADRLRAMGHDVVVAPVLETIFSEEPLPLDCLSIAVTSRNGVRALDRLCDQEMRSELEIFAVGDATAQLAKNFGFSTVSSASGTADDLADLIVSTNVSKISYVCGRDRRGDLEHKLQTRKLDVSVYERYATEFVENFDIDIVALLNDHTIDGVLLYSQRSAESFLSILQMNKLSYLTKEMKFFCLAKNVASAFDEDIKEMIFTADRPDEMTLFSLITKTT